MITSATNPKIKLVRRLLSERRVRQRENAFVAEGTRWLEDVCLTGHRPLFCLATMLWQEKNQPLCEKLTEQGISCLTIETALAHQITETETPSGVFTVLPQPNLPWPHSPRQILLLDGLQDPGNMGTIIRTATAAGADGILLMPGSVDPFNPKVTRSTMGALLRLPLRQIGWDALPSFTDGCHFYLATGDGSQAYTAVDWTIPHALIIGNEAHGVSHKARQIADTPIHIPMQQATESLNAAVAAGIILFEAMRQRG